MRSKEGYKKDQLDRDLARFSVFTDGNPFSVDNFVEHLMTDGGDSTIRANLMFLFAFVPLRHPTKVGATGTHALNMVARVMMSTFDCYASK